METVATISLFPKKSRASLGGSRILEGGYKTQVSLRLVARMPSKETTPKMTKASVDGSGMVVTVNSRFVPVSEKLPLIPRACVAESKANTEELP